MSDIQEEQKRLYKRAEENDKEKWIDISKENKSLLKEIHNREINELQNRINKAYKVLDEITFFTTPIGQVICLDMIISDIKKAKNILQGKEK